MVTRGSGTSPNTRLAHTRLDRPPKDRVKADLYRANCKWVLQICDILISESMEWEPASGHTHFSNEQVWGRASPSLNVGCHSAAAGPASCTVT